MMAYHLVFIGQDLACMCCFHFLWLIWEPYYGKFLCIYSSLREFQDILFFHRMLKHSDSMILLIFFGVLELLFLINIYFILDFLLNHLLQLYIYSMYHLIGYKRLYSRKFLFGLFAKPLREVISTIITYLHSIKVTNVIASLLCDKD